MRGGLRPRGVERTGEDEPDEEGLPSGSGRVVNDREAITGARTLWSRHSTISITLDSYSHVLPNIQKEAVRAIEDVMGEEDDPPSE